MAVLKFQFDESYDDTVMAVGGWIADELEWKRLESTWQKRIDLENRRARTHQQITRYHAAEMNCKSHEYKYWEKEMCLLFSKKLIGMIAKRKMIGISIGCDMKAIQAVFPKGDTEGMKRRSYVLCMKQMMVEIGQIMEKFFPHDTVLLIHDHGNWDDAALEGYNLLIDDPQWHRNGLFEGLVAKTGKQSIGLQAADMIAYECFKGVKAKTIRNDAEMRGAMKEFRKRLVPISSKWIDLNGAKALHRHMKESGRYPDLDERGIT